MGFYYNQQPQQGFYYNQQPEKGFYYNQQPKQGFYYNQENQKEGFYYNQPEGFYYNQPEVNSIIYNEYLIKFYWLLMPENCFCGVINKFSKTLTPQNFRLNFVMFN